MIKKKHLIIFPRLDVPFKKTHQPIPKEKGPIPPIREHWVNFLNNLIEYHKSIKEPLSVLEAPLWYVDTVGIPQIEGWSEVFKSVYVPHRNDFEVPLFKFAKNIEVKYYMQMVYPWLFQVDKKGWGPTSSTYPIIHSPKTPINKKFIDLLRTRQQEGVSKFDQPSKTEWNEKDYVLFVCQIPHDMSIKYHGNGISVLEALVYTAQWCKQNNKKLIIKGHPVNPSSMEAMKGRFPEDRYTWKDKMNINDLLKNAAVVVTVGSGVGMEALLYNKEVVIFGQADYEKVAHRCNRANYDQVLDMAWDYSQQGREEYNKNRAEGFLSEYYKNMIDTTDIESYKCGLT